jgi:hypothetical protein
MHYQGGGMKLIRIVMFSGLTLFAGLSSAQSHFQQKAHSYSLEGSSSSSSSMIIVNWLSASGPVPPNTTFGASFEVCTFYNIATFTITYNADISSYFTVYNQSVPSWCDSEGGQVYYVGTAPQSYECAALST